jgi:hypothetical protein
MAELHPHLQHSEVERVVETIFTSIGEALARAFASKHGFPWRQVALATCLILSGSTTAYGEISMSRVSYDRK